MGSMLIIVWFDLSYTGLKIKKFLKKGKGKEYPNRK